MSVPPAVPAGLPRTPWAIQRVVIFALVLRELRTRVGASWTGLLWLQFEPLGHVLMMVTIFGFLRPVSADIEYPVFLAVGLVPFFMFRNLVLRLLDAVDGNRGLFAYRQVKPIDTFVGRAIVETLLYGGVFVVTVAMLGWLGHEWLPGRPLEFAGVMALLLLLGFALGVLFAVLTHERPKARYVIRLAFVPLYLLSGVIIQVSALPERYREFLLWNPVLHLVELARASFVPHYEPTAGVDALYPLAVTVPALALALALYRVNRLRLLSIQ